MGSTNNEAFLDRQFGLWLRHQRIRMGLTALDVQETTGIHMERISALEEGWTARGITKKELRVLSNLYQVDPELMMAHLYGMTH